MGKKRFLKELGLSLEVVEPREARLEVTGGDSETEEKKPSPPTEERGSAPVKELVAKPGEQHIEAEKEQAAPAQIAETKAGAAIEELARANPEIVEVAPEVDFGESAVDEATPEYTSLLEGKEACGLEPNRATLAAASILPLSLLGSKKTWVWIAVLVCLAIVGYLLIRWYSGRGDSTSPPKQEPQTVEEFIRDF